MALVMITMTIFSIVVQQLTYAESMKVIVILIVNVVVTLSVATTIVPLPFHQMLTVVKVQVITLLCLKAQNTT